MSALFTASRAAFESWAHLDAPHLPDDPIDAMQVRLARWQSRNFAETSDALIALNIGEECGELSQAVADADVVDALGDVCIYAAQLCTANRLAIRLAIRQAIAGLAERRIAEALIEPVGELQHLVLKRAQKIREGLYPVEDYRALLFAAIRRVVHVAEIEARWSVATAAPDAFLATAERVLARNWTANPVTGAATP